MTVAITKDEVINHVS